MLQGALHDLSNSNPLVFQSLADVSLSRQVSTYLHVKDNCVAAAPVYESITLPRHRCRPPASLAFSTPSSSSSSCSSSASSSPSSAAATQPPAPNVSFHQPQGGSSFLFSSLKRMGKKRKRKRDARRHTIQKIMGVEEQRAVLYDTHTWPLKEGRRKKSSSSGAPTAAYVKNPLQGDIETECDGEYSITPYAVSKGHQVAPSLPATHSRSHCRFLSLGSVLSFDLPKDMTLIPPSIQDIITIARPESKTLSDSDPLSQRQTVLSSFRQTRANLTLSTAPGNDDQTVPSDELHENPLTLHDDAEQDWDKMSSRVRINSAEGQRDECGPTPQPPIYVNHIQNATQHIHPHKCLSVHTRIQDLNGHLYHKCSPGVHGAHRESTAPQCHGGTASSSQMLVSLKSTVNVSVRQDSVDSGISTASSARLGPDTATAASCPDNAQPKGVVGRLVSLEVASLDCSRSRTTSTCSPDLEHIHPDHQQFEEEEEELEDIWNRTASHRQSVCSDIMYQPGHEQLPPSEPSISDVPPPSHSPKSPALLYRNLATASAPNLLVAEFKLPQSVHSWLGYDKEQNPRGQRPLLATGNRRSWAAFPNREQTSKATVTVNETAAEPVKLPDVCDNQKYIYQYREDEEEEAQDEEEQQEGEEVERAKVGEEGDEHGSFSQVRSAPDVLQ